MFKIPNIIRKELKEYLSWCDDVELNRAGMVGNLGLNLSSDCLKIQYFTVASTLYRYTYLSNESTDCIETTCKFYDRHDVLITKDDSRNYDIDELITFIDEMTKTESDAVRTAINKLKWGF